MVNYWYINNQTNTTNSWDGLTWATAFPSIIYAANGNKSNSGTIDSTNTANVTAGDIYWIGSNHSETLNAASTATFPSSSAAFNNPNYVFCVDCSVTPPTSPTYANLIAPNTSYATVALNGTGSTLIIGGNVHTYGVNFTSNCSITNTYLFFAAAGYYKCSFENCLFNLTNTGTAPRLIFGGGGGTNVLDIRLNNCKVKFANVSQAITLGRTNLVWRDSTIVDGTGTIPTYLFDTSSSCSGTLERCDLSTLTSGKAITSPLSGSFTSGTMLIKDCKLGTTGGIGNTVSTLPANFGCSRISLIRADISTNTGNNAKVYRTEDYQYSGNLITETNLVRTGGASDGITPISYKIITSANARWYTPYISFPMTVSNVTVGSTVNVTIEGISTGITTRPNNDEFWIEVNYLGNTTTQGLAISGGKANAIAPNSILTASTQTWNSNATVIQRSTAYSASANILYTYNNSFNNSNIFLCTTGGTTSATDPTASSTITDGTGVTDNTAVFTAAVRFKQTIAITPQLVGPISVIVRLAKPSTTYYFDPQIVIS